MFTKIRSIFLSLFFLIYLSTASVRQDESVIAFEPSYISISINENRSVNVRLLTPDLIPPDISIDFLYNNQANDPQGYISLLPNITFTKQTGDDQTRVIIFSEKRDSVREITELLEQDQPLVKPMSFIGQSTSHAAGRKSVERSKK